VDYKDLFKKLVNEKGTGALQVYTSELDHSDGGPTPEVLMQERLKKGKERLDHALETVALLCEPVPPPKSELQHIRYFCGNTEIPDDLKAHEPQRAALYKAAAVLVRAYASIADDLPTAGYGDSQIKQIKQDLDRCVKLREIIRQASGETIDLKAYEADMRHLLDTYIEADASRKISDFDNMGLLDLIVKSGIADAINSLPEGIRSNEKAVAETIINNVRSTIVKKRLGDPGFYDKMSRLLDEIIADLRAHRISYQEFLKRMAEAIKQLQAGKSIDTPEKLNTPGKRALFNALNEDEELALKIDEKVKEVHPADWRGNRTRENVIKGALLPLLGNDMTEVERIFLILVAQKEY
jgi:type I restriction enzyme R subunit